MRIERSKKFLKDIGNSIINNNNYSNDRNKQLSNELKNMNINELKAKLEKYKDMLRKEKMKRIKEAKITELKKPSKIEEKLHQAIAEIQFYIEKKQKKPQDKDSFAKQVISFRNDLEKLKKVISTRIDTNDYEEVQQYNEDLNNFLYPNKNKSNSKPKDEIKKISLIKDGSMKRISFNNFDVNSKFKLFNQEGISRAVIGAGDNNKMTRMGGQLSIYLNNNNNKESRNKSEPKKEAKYDEIFFNHIKENKEKVTKEISKNIKKLKNLRDDIKETLKRDDIEYKKIYDDIKKIRNLDVKSKRGKSV